MFLINFTFFSKLCALNTGSEEQTIRHQSNHPSFNQYIHSIQPLQRKPQSIQYNMRLMSTHHDISKHFHFSLFIINIIIIHQNNFHIYENSNYDFLIYTLHHDPWRQRNLNYSLCISKSWIIMYDMSTILFVRGIGIEIQTRHVKYE